MKTKKKTKVFKKMLDQAKVFLDQVEDSDLGSLEDIQNTMNNFLASQGLPSVDLGVGSSSVLEVSPELRSFDEVENELSNFFNGS